MLADLLPPLFLDTYILSTSSFGCKALSTVLSFLVPWSIRWNSSLINFKNGPEYLAKGKVQVFINFMRFLPYTLVSSSFLLPPRFSFFFRFHVFNCVRFQYFQVIVSFLFTGLFDAILIWYFYHCYFIPCEFFAAASANGLSLQYVWEHISPDLQESSEYSSRSQKYCMASKSTSPFNNPLVMFQTHQLQLV